MLGETERGRERSRERGRERELTTCLGVGGEEEWHQVLIRSVHVDFGSEVVNRSRSCTHVDGTRALIRGPAYCFPWFTETVLPFTERKIIEKWC